MRKIIQIRVILFVLILQLLFSLIGCFMIITIEFFELPTNFYLYGYIMMAIVLLLISYLIYPFIAYWAPSKGRIIQDTFLFLFNFGFLFFQHARILIILIPVIFIIRINSWKKNEDNDIYDIFKYKIGIYGWIVFIIIAILNIFLLFDRIILISIFTFIFN